MDKNPTQIVPVNQSIVMPAVNTEEAIEAWKQYQDLKKGIVDDNDIQKIQGKDFLKKSYWRKVATFFNLTTEVVEEKKEMIGKTYVWHFTVKATAPNGRSAIGVGSCDVYEKATLREGIYMIFNKYEKKWEDAQPNSIHNIRSTAETRAFNRAISNLVGGGEVSAEEVEQQNTHPSTEVKTGEVVSEENSSGKYYCYLHKKDMKERTKKDGTVYFDHRWQDDAGSWHKCNGKDEESS